MTRCCGKTKTGSGWPWPNGPALSNAVTSNRAPRVEGRGPRQADGTIVAATIKAEIDN